MRNYHKEKSRPFFNKQSFATYSKHVKRLFINDLHYSQNDLKELKNIMYNINNLNLKTNKKDSKKAKIGPYSGARNESNI